ARALREPGQPVRRGLPRRLEPAARPHRRNRRRGGDRRARQRPGGPRGARRCHLHGGGKSRRAGAPRGPAGRAAHRRAGRGVRPHHRGQLSRRLLPARGRARQGSPQGQGPQLLRRRPGARAGRAGRVAAGRRAPGPDRRREGRLTAMPARTMQATPTARPVGSRARRSGVPAPLLAPCLIRVFVFFLLPLGLMCWRSLASEGFSLAPYAVLFTSPLYVKVLLTTVKMASIATAFALLLAYPIAYTLTVSSGKLRGAILLFILIP